VWGNEEGIDNRLEWYLKDDWDPCCGELHPVQQPRASLCWMLDLIYNMEIETNVEESL
jgi:hypothetical protein